MLARCSVHFCHHIGFMQVVSSATASSIKPEQSDQLKNYNKAVNMWQSQLTHMLQLSALGHRE